MKSPGLHIKHWRSARIKSPAQKNFGNSTMERQNLHGASSDILLSLAVITIPITILSALLLGLISQNQLHQTYSALPGVPDPQATDSSALLVNFSASRLLTVASLIFTVSSLLPSFVMTLLSYPIARHILKASAEEKRTELPTPYQLSLQLGVRFCWVIVALNQV
jgi:hypothetical protein